MAASREKAKTITSEEFEADPKAAFDYAVEHGPVTIEGSEHANAFRISTQMEPIECCCCEHWESEVSR